MKLYLIHPVGHFNYFKDHIDGIVVFPMQFLKNNAVRKMCEDYKSAGKEIILSNNFYEYETVNFTLIENCLKEFKFDYFFGNESKDPTENLKMAINNIEVGRQYETKPILSWWGDSSHLACLYLLNKDVGLTFSTHTRQKFLSRTTIKSDEVWYLGFTNIKELKTNPPKALITGAPITSAYFGVDLKERVRRPKNLPINSLTRELPETLLPLCLENIKAVKEAGNAR